MKRTVSLFLFVFFCFFAVPLSVSATNYRIVNLNDMISVKYDASVHTASLDFRLGVHGLSPQQAFFVKVLESCYKVDNNDDNFRNPSFAELEDWQESVYQISVSANDMSAWDAIEILMKEYIFDESTSASYLAFSAHFCLTIDIWLDVWNDVHGTSFECPFSYVDSLALVRSYGYVIYRETPLAHNDFLAASPTIWCLSIDSVTDYQPLASQGLTTFWEEFLSTMDITLLTSWLPDSISSVFISRWAIFISISGILLTIKLVHG